MHGAALGPGPLAASLIQAANVINTALQLRVGSRTEISQSNWIKVPAQSVPFQVADRRVHHQHLLFVADNMQIYMSGSVGFDQSLSLLAQVPVPDEWLAGQPHLAALRGQSIQIPITGTLNRPQVDERALQRLAADTARRATGQILENELRKGLQRWLDPGQ